MIRGNLDGLHRVIHPEWSAIEGNDAFNLGRSLKSNQESHPCPQRVPDKNHRSSFACGIQDGLDARQYLIDTNRTFGRVGLTVARKIGNDDAVTFDQRHCDPGPIPRLFAFPME